MKCYILEGSCGSYEDKQEWVVKVFLSEKKAEEYRGKVQERAEEIYKWCSENKEWFKNIPENEFDPYMQMDYDCASYSISEAELDDEEEEDNMKE